LKRPESNSSKRTAEVRACDCEIRRRRNANSPCAKGRLIREPSRSTGPQLPTFQLNNRSESSFALVKTVNYVGRREKWMRF
jgi:hypothetical protein